MRWRLLPPLLLVKLPLLLLGAWLVHVAVGNLTWIGLLRTGLPVDQAMALCAGVFVVAMVGVEGLLSGWARAWGRLGLWSLVWLMHTAGAIRVRWAEEVSLAQVAVIGPILLAAGVMAWRRLSKRKARGEARPLILGGD